jgi:threonine aldolase
MGDRGFASDNNSGIHPAVFDAIGEANDGHCIGYGDDVYTEKAMHCFKKAFGEDAAVFLVCTGTGANVLALRAVTQSYHAIICAHSSHLNTDECGAPEKQTGCKVTAVASSDGKIMPDQIEPLLQGRMDEHQSQPRVVSISQSTEFGTVYSIDEIHALADFAHANDMKLHMDGARLSNAAVSLGCGFRTMTRDAGVDILSFGGTKNGMMMGEAVLFFNPADAEYFKFIRKQGTHLVSKMRFLSAQFTAFFKDDLWHHNATHANNMAALLAEELGNIPQIRIVQNVQANAVFLTMPDRIVDELQKRHFFYIFDHEQGIARLMTSFDTTEQDVHRFIADMKKLLKGHA